MSATVNDVLKIAQKYADTGYKEGKNNDSMFGDWYKLPNNPWCAMFVSYCFHAAGAGKLVGPGPKGFASCSTGMAWLEKHATKVSPAKAQPGDIVFFQWDNGSPDHVGLVLSTHPNTRTLKTVEGNTGAPKGSKGEGVYYKTRSYDVVEAIYRPDWAKVAPKPAATVAPATPVAPVVPVAPTTPIVEKPVTTELPGGATITSGTVPTVVVTPGKQKPTPTGVSVPIAAKVFVKVLPGDSYWKIAEVLLKKKRVTSPIAVTKEMRRIQKLNGNKKLIPGAKIQVL